MKPLKWALYGCTGLYVLIETGEVVNMVWCIGNVSMQIKYICKLGWEFALWFYVRITIFFLQKEWIALSLSVKEQISRFAAFVSRTRFSSHPYLWHKSRRFCSGFQTKHFWVPVPVVSCFSAASWYDSKRQLQLPVLAATCDIFNPASTFWLWKYCVCAGGSTARSFSLWLFSPRLLNFVYCSSAVFVPGREGLTKIVSCSPCGAWRSEI